MTLVFVHGAGCTAAVFQEQLHAFPDAVGITLPGHTTPGSATSIAEFTNFLAAEITRRGLRDIIVCGSSMGGAIALEYALRTPEELRAIVLLGASSRLRVASTIFDGLERDFATMTQTLAGYFYADATPERVAASSTLMQEVGQAQTLADFRACDAFDCTDRLGEIAYPLLALTGESDVMTPPKHAATLADRVQHGQARILPAAGHLAMIERPADTNEALAAFVASIDASR